MIKRALFIGGYPNAVEEYLKVFFQNLIFAIADMGIECHVISPVSITKYRGNIKKIKEHTVDITHNNNKVYVHYPRFVSYSSKDLKVFNTGCLSEAAFQRAALSEVKKLGIDFDCVYGHFIVGGGLAAIKIGRRYNIPSFIAYGECDYESQVRVRFRDLKPADVKDLSGIISVSSKNTCELHETGLFEQVPIFLSPNAINHKEFHVKDKSECRNKFGLPEDKFIVGFVGGFIPRKGHLRVLEACNRIEGVYMAFAGRGADAPTGDKVLYVNGLPHEEVCDFLNAVDVFVLPTLNEGCCNAVLEALSTGTPVVSSALPFNDDILTDDNSIRIDPMSIDEIEEAIRRIKDSAELREKLSSEALETASQMTISKRAENIVGFINDICSK